MKQYVWLHLDRRGSISVVSCRSLGRLGYRASVVGRQPVGQVVGNSDAARLCGRKAFLEHYWQNISFSNTVVHDHIMKNLLRAHNLLGTLRVMGLHSEI